jgi:hypothetical protein
VLEAYLFHIFYLLLSYLASKTGAESRLASTRVKGVEVVAIAALEIEICPVARCFVTAHVFVPYREESESESERGASPLVYCNN